MLRLRYGPLLDYVTPSQTSVSADKVVFDASSHFVAQIRAMIPVMSVAILVVDQEEAISKVVYTWGAPHQVQNAAFLPVSSPLVLPTSVPASVCVPLAVPNGLMGVALIRGDGLGDLTESPVVRQAATYLGAGPVFKV